MRQRNMSQGRPEFSRTVRIDEIAGKRTELVIEPAEDELKALSDRLGLQEIKFLKGRIVLTPWNKNGVRADMALTAKLIQLCSVSLEPIEVGVDERFNVPFLPAEEIRAQDDDVGLEPNDDDPPEPIIEGAIDLGELVVQLLAISTNPYPRNSDASLEVTSEGEQSNPENSDPNGRDGEGRQEGSLFSSLQALKNRLS